MSLKVIVAVVAVSIFAIYNWSRITDAINSSSTLSNPNEWVVHLNKLPSSPEIIKHTAYKDTIVDKWDKVKTKHVALARFKTAKGIVDVPAVNFGPSSNRQWAIITPTNPAFTIVTKLSGGRYIIKGFDHERQSMLDAYAYLNQAVSVA
ncbi:serine protease [Acrasis kona]|uniref:Serine protease n=1 Tax=Acrasis kona TaxID=1008807 RepID=A0AAW2YYI6_9EUKA